MKKYIKIWRFLLLFIPLLVAIVILIYVRTSQEVSGAEYMAPIENTTMIISLMVFIAGYLCFLILMFFDDIKSFFIKQKATK